MVGFEDLVDGQSLTETLDESTGIAKRMVIDWRSGSARGQQDLRPALVIKGKDGKILKLARGGDARYMLAVDAIISVDPGAQGPGGRRHRPHPDRKRQDARHHRRSAAGRRTVRGAAAEGVRGHRGNLRHRAVRPRLQEQAAHHHRADRQGRGAREYLVAKGKHIHLQDGDVIEKGDFIVEGNPAPHDILAIKGVEELAGYLVNEIQDVYRLQGVDDQRQAHRSDRPSDAAEGRDRRLRRDRPDPGRAGRQVEFDEVNARAVEEGKKPAIAHPVLFGITKASLQTRSFISAASFQETTRVLTEAAVDGKADTLDGLKENVIVGRLIPAGTGAMMNRLREVAIKRDALILAEREKEAAAKAEAAVARGAATGGVSRSAATNESKGLPAGRPFFNAHGDRKAPKPPGFPALFRLDLGGRGPKHTPHFTAGGELRLFGTACRDPI